MSTTKLSANGRRFVTICAHSGLISGRKGSRLFAHRFRSVFEMFATPKHILISNKANVPWSHDYLIEPQTSAAENTTRNYVHTKLVFNPINVPHMGNMSYKI